MVARPEGWELRLAAVIEAARARPFAWGRTDCAVWASEIVVAVTGRAIIADWLDQYRTKREARWFVRERGFDTLAEIVSSYLGAPLPSPAMASRGDIMLAPGEALGVCTGREALFLAPRGLTPVPVADCLMAWRL